MVMEKVGFQACGSKLRLGLFQSFDNRDDGILLRCCIYFLHENLSQFHSSLIELLFFVMIVSLMHFFLLFTINSRVYFYIALITCLRIRN